MVETKFCRKCQRTLPLSHFSKRSLNKSDGRQPYCKDCHASYMNNYNKNNRNLEAHALSQRAYINRNPDISRAHHTVSRAIESGILVRPEICPNCNEARDIEAHHKDYSKPLDVYWLCTKCHGLDHRELANAGL